MSTKPGLLQKVKSVMHPRNKHREQYNFNELIAACNDLSQYVFVNKYNNQTIDFFNPLAVKTLNKALLFRYYNIDYWDIPEGYLCPPIPGRADYIHYIADLLANSNNNMIPTGSNIRCLDIGVGANCVYPVIGRNEYDWSFVGSDIDPVAIASASKIINSNTSLSGNVDLRLQKNVVNIFKGIIAAGEQFDLTICNPPFHASPHDAQAGTLRKLSNLKGRRVTSPTLNFGGLSNELWYKGGELLFIQNMVHESKIFSKSCLWFSTLISKQDNVDKVIKTLQKIGVAEIKIIPMEQGNKISRIVAWTYFSPIEQNLWMSNKRISF